MTSRVRPRLLYFYEGCEMTATEQGCDNQPENHVPDHEMVCTTEYFDILVYTVNYDQPEPGLREMLEIENHLLLHPEAAKRFDALTAEEKMTVISAYDKGLEYQEGFEGGTVANPRIMNIHEKMMAFDDEKRELIPSMDVIFYFRPEFVEGEPVENRWLAIYLLDADIEMDQEDDRQDLEALFAQYHAGFQELINSQIEEFSDGSPKAEMAIMEICLEAGDTTLRVADFFGLDRETYTDEEEERMWQSSYVATVYQNHVGDLPNRHPAANDYSLN